MPDLVGTRSPLRTFDFLSLCRHWRLIGACGTMSLIAGLAFIAFKPVTYTSSTQLLVYIKEVQPGPDPVISPGRADLTQVQNEIEIIRSRGMLTKVARSLDLADDEEFVPKLALLRAQMQRQALAPGATFDNSLVKLAIAAESLEKHVKVQRVGTSHTMLVSVSASDPEKSARIANAIGQIAPQTSFRAEQEGDRPALRERLQGLGPNAYVMTGAGVPERPDGPRKFLVLPAAAILGIAIGSALALLLDFTNRTIRTAAQVEYFGMECIGAIPRRRRRGSHRTNRAISKLRMRQEDEFLPHAMLDQTLRRMLVTVEASKARSIGIASAVAGEGGTMVAQCLAQLAVRSQKKVLLVDASRIEPVLPTKQNGSLEPAHVTDYGRRTRGCIIQDEIPDLDVLRVGGLGMDCVGSTAAEPIPNDQHCLDRYTLIIVDLPPLERGPEFRMAAQNLDGLLLVLKWGSTTLDKVEQAIAASGVGPSEFIGAVLNGIEEPMIGKFGDKLWEAEARLAARCHPLKFRYLAS